MSGDLQKEYLVSLMQNISELEYLCDVTLVAGVDGEKFDVHRTIMLASSPYFRALLGPNYKEAKQNEIVLSKVDGRTLKTIIQFCYSGFVEITADTVKDIVAAASSMELVQLEQRCSDFWSKNLRILNCVDILTAADKYNLKGLWCKSFQYICENLIKIPPTNMVTLDEKNFNAILAGEEISTDERNVFDCFVQWIKHDESNRSKSVALLANSIRLKFIPVEFLREKVEPFYEKHGCGKLVIDEYRIRARDSGIIKLNRSIRTKSFSVSTYSSDSSDSMI